MNTRIFFIIFIFLENIPFIFSENFNTTSHLDNSRFNAVYRIDSVLNNYSLTFKDEKLKFVKEKKGKEQNFRIVPTGFNDAYLIESREANKRLGINENNDVVLYDKNSKKKNKISWNIFLVDNGYIIQNKYSKKFLELNKKNSTYFYIKCSKELIDPENEEIIKDVEKVRERYKFTFLKLFEETNIKPEHIRIIDDEPVDVLIKYIDLSDKNLTREGIKQIKKDEDNGELRYCVRSILQFIPWVRKIFILMPNERVQYFKPYKEINGKIIYVKDKDLLGFDSAASRTFQFNAFRMKKFGMSDNFLLMDDDYFFGKPVKKSDFFYYDEKEKKVFPNLVTDDFEEISIKETDKEYLKLFKRIKSIKPHSFNGWKIAQLAAFKLMYGEVGEPLINGGFNHNAISLNVHDIEEIYDFVKEKYPYPDKALNAITRDILGIQPQSLFNIYMLNKLHRKVHSIPWVYIDLASAAKCDYNIEMFVINTSGDRKYTKKHYKKGKETLEKIFPLPTQFEIINEDEIKDKTKNNTCLANLEDYIEREEYDRLKKINEDLKKRTTSSQKLLAEERRKNIENRDYFSENQERYADNQKQLNEERRKNKEIQNLLNEEKKKYNEIKEKLSEEQTKLKETKNLLNKEKEKNKEIQNLLDEEQNKYKEEIKKSNDIQDKLSDHIKQNDELVIENSDLKKQREKLKNEIAKEKDINKENELIKSSKEIENKRLMGIYKTIVIALGIIVVILLIFITFCSLYLCYSSQKSNNKYHETVQQMIELTNKSNYGQILKFQKLKTEEDEDEKTKKNNLL